MMYLREGDQLFVFASRGGGPTNPAWYLNLLAHPEVTVEIGDQTSPAIAQPVTGAEHDSIYARWAQLTAVSAVPGVSGEHHPQHSGD